MAAPISSSESITVALGAAIGAVAGHYGYNDPRAGLCAGAVAAVANVVFSRVADQVFGEESSLPKTMADLFGRMPVVYIGWGETLKAMGHAYDTAGQVRGQMRTAAFAAPIIIACYALVAVIR